MDKILLGIIGGAIVGITVLIGISDFQIPETKQKISEADLLPEEKLVNWISSGPFHINKRTYDIGESIFMRVENLMSEEKGQIAILRQSNDTHYSVWKTVFFDGSKKPFFNQYWTPRLSVVNGICSADDISGNWTMVFRGTDYPNLEFEFTDQVIMGEEKNFDKIIC